MRGAWGGGAGGKGSGAVVGCDWDGEVAVGRVKVKRLCNADTCEAIDPALTAICVFTMLVWEESALDGNIGCRSSDKGAGA